MRAIEERALDGRNGGVGGTESELNMRPAGTGTGDVPRNVPNGHRTASTGPPTQQLDAAVSGDSALRDPVEDL